MDVPTDLSIRALTEADRPAVIELCRRSLGWKPDDPNEEFFRWKHDENAFGPSPGWAAVTPDGRLAGLRVFMRWRFRHPSGRTMEAVRAVDTATHPDWQGKGIFRTLTEGAIAPLTEQGIQFVFNTPNDKSRPGYLKMGWQVVGRVPVAVRPTGPTRLGRVAKARTAAELWSLPCSAGESVHDILASAPDLIERLVGRPQEEGRIVTDRSTEFLRWRYGFGPLHYRVMAAGSGLGDGIVIFRTRRRGAALEATIVEVLADPGAARSAFRRIARETGADYLIRAAPEDRRSQVHLVRSGFLAAPPLGPILTWRPLADAGVPTLADLGLELGDLELF